MKSLRLSEQQYDALKKRKSLTTPASTRVLERAVKEFAPTLRALAEHDNADRWPLVLRDQILEAGLPEPFREFVWHPTRNFRADLAWPEKQIIIECDGAVHRIKGKWLKDIEKHNLMAKHGWVCIRVTPDMVRKGEALQWVREFIA